MTLEKTKLIDNIHRQRELISKLTNNIFVSNVDSNSLNFLKLTSNYPKPTPSKYFKRIDRSSLSIVLLYQCQVRVICGQNGQSTDSEENIVHSCNHRYFIHSFNVRN